MNKKEYLLTIAIPTYNREQMLKECVDRILEQDNNNIEIVISDNGSTDNTENYCKKLCDDYSFISYYRNQKNEGFDVNYRNCIKYSHGKYVLVLSDDDLISKNFIKNLFPLLESGENDFIALNLKGFDLSEKDINEENEKGFIFSTDKDLYFDKKDFYSFYSTISYWFTLVSMFVMKKELISDFSDSDNEKYVGSWFMNVAHNLLCLSKANNAMISGACFLNIRTNNYAHYNIYEVFFSKFKYVLYDCSKSFDIPKKYVKVCYRKLFKDHMRHFEYLIKVGKITTFKTKPKFKYILKTLTYKESWIYYIPVALCPSFILKSRYKRRHNL